MNEDFITFEFINLRMIMKISRLNFPAKIPVYWTEKSNAKKLDNLDEKNNVDRKKWRMKNPSTMIRINSEIMEKVIFPYNKW